jgi:hypothetical protein
MSAGAGGGGARSQVWLRQLPTAAREMPVPEGERPAAPGIVLSAGCSDFCQGGAAAVLWVGPSIGYTHPAEQST